FIELLRFSRIITHQTFPQLILVGDPCQLRKPRPDKGYEDWPEHRKQYYDWDSVFMCDSDVWKELNIKIVCLTQNFRQSDAGDVAKMNGCKSDNPPREIWITITPAIQPSVNSKRKWKRNAKKIRYLFRHNMLLRDGIKWTNTMPKSSKSSREIRLSYDPKRITSKWMRKV